MSPRDGLQLVLASTLSVIVLYFAFNGIDVAALTTSLSTVRPLGVFFYLVALCLIQVAKAVRWGILISPFVNLRARAIWQTSNVGNMLIMLLPLRLGELSRPLMLRKMCSAPAALGLGAATIERVLDGLLVTLLFYAVTFEQQQATLPPVLIHGARLALAIFVATIIFLALAVFAKSQLLMLLDRGVAQVSPTLTARLKKFLQSFLLGLQAMPDLRTFLGIVGWTLAYWIMNALGVYALMLGFDLDLPLLAAFTVVCVLVVGIMVPAGPGLLGTYQAALMAGLSIYGVEQAVAAALSVVAYLGNLVIVVGFGLASIRHVPWRFANLFQSAPMKETLAD